MAAYFTSKDLAEIDKRTDLNNHTENYIFISQKINSNLLKSFKQIKKISDVDGLDGNVADKQYKLYQKLMKELQKKAPSEYELVHSRL